MSCSFRRSQVERLAKELAGLEEKLAAARHRASDSRMSALRASGSISKSTSASTAESRLREARRHEQAAIGHDKKAAEITGQMATKRKSLMVADRDLAAAQESERKKQVSAADRQRRQDMQRLRELERDRRATHLPFQTPTAAGHVPRAREPGSFEYDVCLSFAGEQRPYVEMVARGLRDSGIRCFYDVDEAVRLWGKDLPEEFDRIYRTASRYCVMFISAEYAEKAWTRMERRFALARALEERGEYVLPVRFDDTELPGLPPTTAYLDLKEIAPASLVELIVEKVRSTKAEMATDDEPAPAPDS